MSRPKSDSTVLTVRVPAALERRLAQEARRRRTSRSEVARTALEAALGTGPVDLPAEARRQSLLVDRKRTRKTDAFWLAIADTAGWK